MSDTTEAAGFATLAIHAGAQPDLVLHTLLPPAMRDTGAVDHPVDPAAAALEERVATIEGGTAAVAVASGPASRILALHALMQPGDEVVAARRLDDGFDAALRAFGWRVRWAEADKPETLVEALSDRTKAILVDSLAAPDGRVADLETIATIARRARVPFVVDNTLATPYLVRPLEHGADVVLHTSGRLLGGHAGADCGLVVDGGSFSFAGDLRYPALSQPSRGGLVVAETYGNYALAMGARRGLRDLGGPPSPFAAYLVATGIETLALRLQRQCDSALAVARHLARHPKVAWVRYAGLERDAGRALAQRYSPKGAGGALAFGVVDGPALASRLRLFLPATETGGAGSAILRAALEAISVSIGLEDLADIIADLDRALVG